MKVEVAREYTESEHQTWNMLFKNLEYCRTHQAHPIFSQGVDALGIDGNRIPDLTTINSKLSSMTGWEGVPVEGLEEADSFFIGLRERKFPIGNFIRDKEDLSYTPAPDVFHDLYGHLPFLANKDFASFCHDFGKRACKYLNQPERLRQFERLFWFGVEFPLIETTQGRRIFGGGILSSKGESNYALGNTPEVLPFNIEVIRNLDYKIDEFQNKLFLLQSENQLYNCLDDLEKEGR